MPQDLLGELLRAMLDVGVPAVDLLRDETPRIVELRDRVMSELVLHSEGLSALSSEKPWQFERMDLASAVLEAGLNDRYLTVPRSVFTMIDPESRVLSTHPELLARFDDKGLVDLSGLQSGGYGFRLGGDVIQWHQFFRRDF